MASEPPSVGASLRVQEGSQAERGAGVADDLINVKGHGSRRHEKLRGSWEKWRGLAMQGVKKMMGQGSKPVDMAHISSDTQPQVPGSPVTSKSRLRKRRPSISKVSPDISTAVQGQEEGIITSQLVKQGPVISSPSGIPSSGRLDLSDRLQSSGLAGQGKQVARLPGQTPAPKVASHAGWSAAVSPTTSHGQRPTLSPALETATPAKSTPTHRFGYQPHISSPPRYQPGPPSRIPRAPLSPPQNPVQDPLPGSRALTGPQRSLTTQLQSRLAALSSPAPLTLEAAAPSSLQSELPPRFSLNPLFDAPSPPPSPEGWTHFLPAVAAPEAEDRPSANPVAPQLHSPVSPATQVSKAHGRTPAEMVLPDTLPEMEEQQPRERAEAEDEVGAEPARARGGDTASGDGAGARFSTSMEVVATLLDGGTCDQAISQEAQGVRAQKAAASDGTANRELDTTATMEEPVSQSFFLAPATGAPPSSESAQRLQAQLAETLAGAQELQRSAAVLRERLLHEHDKRAAAELQLAKSEAALEASQVAADAKIRSLEREREAEVEKEGEAARALKSKMRATAAEERTTVRSLEAAEEESVALEARLGETGRDWESHHELETAQRNRAAVQGEGQHKEVTALRANLAGLRKELVHAKSEPAALAKQRDGCRKSWRSFGPR